MKTLERLIYYIEQNNGEKAIRETKLLSMLKDVQREHEEELRQVKSVDLADVGNLKHDETLELLSEIVDKIKLANEDVENGIYDPMLECAKHIHNKYKIVRR